MGSHRTGQTFFLPRQVVQCLRNDVGCIEQTQVVELQLAELPAFISPKGRDNSLLLPVRRHCTG